MMLYAPSLYGVGSETTAPSGRLYVVSLNDEGHAVIKDVHPDDVEALTTTGGYTTQPQGTPMPEAESVPGVG